MTDDSRRHLHAVRFQDKVEARLDMWTEQRFLRRLWDKDPTLWFSEPVPELTDRLGWLGLPQNMAAEIPDLGALADDVKSQGIRSVVLLGMGGSSLAPEVFSEVLKAAPGYPQLLVLDSTHPDEVRTVEEAIAPEEALFIVSSKSGTTLETLSLFRYFWAIAGHADDHPGKRFIAVTDPESPLEKLAVQRKFRRVFLTPADVGGRYSAFSYFGLVPAALSGFDPTALLEFAAQAQAQNSAETQPQASPGLALGAFLGEAAGERDKLTFFTSSSLQGFPIWLEQLVAESTGKQGRGLVPVVGEPMQPADAYGSDRCFLFFLLQGDDTSHLQKAADELIRRGHPVALVFLESAYSVAREMYHWEIAVPSASSIMGVHPFDQPDVQLSKERTRAIMTAKAETEPGGGPFPDALSLDSSESSAAGLYKWLEGAQPGDYLGIQAYLPRHTEIRDRLQSLQSQLLEKTGLATTLGFGPRFLHSTGQLHKGGPATGRFIQLVDTPVHDLPIPETGSGFASLIRAQALGDFQALQERGRNVIRVSLGEDARSGLEFLSKALVKVL